jgi:hypothetical protein
MQHTSWLEAEPQLSQVTERLEAETGDRQAIAELSGSTEVGSASRQLGIQDA